MMGCLQIRFPQMGFVGVGGGCRIFSVEKLRGGSLMVGSSCCSKMKVSCGLRGSRGRPRKASRRLRDLSTEVIQAVQSLKLARSAAKLDEVFDTRVSRLLKDDLIATLAELQRQNELELALKVFEFVRKEPWYKPDLSLYSDMIFMFGKNKLIVTAEEFFSEVQKEGLKPDARTYTEMIGAFFQVGMVEKAVETYRTMKESGCAPDMLTLTIMIRNLEKAGEEELASTIKNDCEVFLDSPEEFLEELERKSQRRSLVNA